ncbi:tape measure protein [Empedobacter falsenii]
MDISNGRLGFTQDLDNQKFLNALRQSNRGVTDFNIHLQNNFNQSLVSVNDLAKGVTAFLTIDMARDFVTQMVKIRGEFEQTEIAFNTMLQSREKGNALMQEMVELAKNTPMQFSEVSKGAKQLLAYQVEVEKLTGTLSMLGDISSGLGVPISRLILVYGQVRAKGRLMGDDLRQFTEAGVPMIAMIAKNMGIAESAVADMVSAGKVGFKDVEKVLEQLTSQGGLFYNMMEEQSKTIPGQIAKLQDEIEQMFNSIGKDSQGFVSDVIGGASSVVENYKEIGNVLGVLITTYGAYKAALILVSTAESTHIKNSAIANESKLNNLRTTLQETEANLALAKSEDAVALSKLESVQAGLAKERIKGKELLSAIDIAHAERNQAQAVVDAAQKKYDAYKGSAFVLNEKRAAIELENAITELNTKNENVNSASKTYNTQQTKIQTLSKEAQLLTTEKSITAKTVENTQEAVNTVNKNINDLATKRLTLSQHWYALKTTLAANAQAFLNATMLSNPIVAVVAAVGALVAAYYFLADHTTAAEKAQEAYNKTQEEVKSKLDETKQKAEEYINILKDETATVYQQLQAYKALQLLKLKGIENLTQEQIATMDLTELRKLLNAAYDDKSLTSQESELNNLYRERERLTKEISDRNKDSKGVLNSKEATSELISKLEVIEIKYQKQLDLVNKTKHEQQLANLPLRDRYQYWENEIKKIEEAITENENLNFGVKSTNPLIKDNTDAANIFKIALQSVNINPLLAQLGEANKQFSAIKAEMGGTAIPEIKNKAYYDKYQKKAEFTLDNLDLDDPKNAEKIKALRTIIEGTTNALKKYNNEASKTKSPKPKTPKKSDDPVEIYKKQVSEIEKQYEQYLKILDSNDVTFATEKAILKAQLSSKGASYEEYLRVQQKELIKTAKTSDVARKKLLLINDELLKLSKHSELQIFKEDFEKQLDDLDSVIEKLYEVQNLKESLRGKSDPLSMKKIEFIDEKQKELLKDSENAARSLFKTLTDESKPLDAINKKFDAQLFLLKKKINDANEEISKLTISASSSPEGSDERIKIEEKILKLKKEILDTQNLIDFNESKRTVETKNVTNNVDYNKLLSEYQSYEDKIKTIDDKMKADLLTNQTYYESQKKSLIEQGKVDELKTLEDIKKAKDAQIKKQASDDTSDIAKNQLMGSEEWANLFSNMDEMTFQQIDNLIKQIEGKFNLLKGKFNPIDLKVILKQLNQAKNLVIEKNPFGSLAVGLADLFKGAEEETNSSAEGITTKWNRVAKSLTGTFDFINDAIDSAGVLKEFLGETASSAMETTQTVLGIGSSVLAVSQMTTEGIKGVEKASVILAIISAVIQIATKIANLLSNIFSKDKKKQKEINKHKEAVDNLTNSYKDLEDAAKRALGSDVYSGQKQMIENLKQQQIEYQKMIELEKTKKKKDSGKIKEWEDALRDSKNTIQDLLEEIAEDVVQTNAKDLATELGDALVEAFGKGEDAAKAFAEVANNVLKNAVLNQLKKRFLEDQLKGALDKLYEDMGGSKDGTFNFNGLSPEEQQAFRDKIKEISQNFSSMLGEYSNLFKDLVDPNENSLSGAIKGVSEETASIIAGQVNAMRLLIVEANKTRIESNKILLQSLDRLANIDFNTRSANVILDKMYAFMQNNKDNNRSYGF